MIGNPGGMMVQEWEWACCQAERRKGIGPCRVRLGTYLVTGISGGLDRSWRSMHSIYTAASQRQPEWIFLTDTWHSSHVW